MSRDARMELSPDEIRETDEGYYLDCPECGTPTRFMRIIEAGRCAGYEEGEVDCDAELALELVWES